MSITTKSLLVELLVEELPPRSLKRLGEAFSDDIFFHLRKLDFIETSSVKMSFASPRRLAVHVTNVREKCPDVPERKKLVPVEVAFDTSGKPSSALLKRLEKEGAALSDTCRAFENGKEFVWLDRVAPGVPLSYLLESIILAAISNLPIPKVMTYQLADGWSSVDFVRPAHSLIALHGAEIVPVSVLGLDAGRETQGHRFETSVNPVVLKNADSYAQQLETEGAVIASFAARRAEIARQLATAATKEKLRPIEDEILLDEVTALVERPNVLVGEFDATFLEVPQECLILTMKANQKYFPLLDATGKLTNRFLIVSNIRPADASLVISGNERVLRARLADARFFFDKDRKKPLDSRVLDLAKVVYHNKLGSQGERVQRVQSIAISIATKLGDKELAQQADQAALLSKADLLTDMVSEFPELQGIMGRYYAQHDGLSDEVAYAIEDHYKPRFAGDELPRNMVGVCVALADKLATLVDMFGIGEIPTGDKDPFALRRHALGVIHMLIERDLPLGLDWLFHAARLADARKVIALSDFIYDRFRYFFTIKSFDEQANESFKHGGPKFYIASATDRLYSPQQMDAVLTSRPQFLNDAVKRLTAVRNFAALPEAASLAAANKRVSNILKKVEGDFVLRQAQDERFGIDAALLQEPAEQALHQALSQIAPKAEAAFAAGDYTASLQALAALKEPVDTFFDKVMVNTEDVALRANRLALLLQLQHAMNRVADISKLAT